MLVHDGNRVVAAKQRLVDFRVPLERTQVALIVKTPQRPVMNEDILAAAGHRTAADEVGDRIKAGDGVAADAVGHDALGRGLGRRRRHGEA